MNKKKAGIAFIALLTCALAGQALAQGSEIEFKSNADDLTKIRSVVEEFRKDIIRKDGYALTKLVLNPNVLFHHTNDQEEVDSARKYNAQFDGIGPSALDGFAKFLSTSKDKLEEKFYNIEIRQDGPLAWIIHEVSSQKRKDALKRMMNTGFRHPASSFGASIACYKVFYHS